MQLTQYNNEFALTTWFNKLLRPVLSTAKVDNKHFVVIGCSSAYGYGLDDYAQAWPSELSRLIDMDHVNLSMPGSANDWMIRRLNRVLQDYNPNFIIVQLTFTERSTKASWLRFIFGDLNSRDIKFDVSTGHEIKNNITKIRDILEQYKHVDNVYFTNVWYFNSAELFALKSLATQYKNFIPNLDSPIDQAKDNQHVGPNTHKTLAHLLFSKLDTKS